MKVVLQGTDHFPKEISGLWVSDYHTWQLFIAPNGTIQEARIALGAVDIRPGKTTAVDMRGGGKSLYEPGIWTLIYDAPSRDLSVEIVLDHFYADVGHHALKGSSTDILVGTISDDFQTWSVDWYNTGHFVALLPDPNEFWRPTEPEFRDHIVFRKVEGAKGLIDAASNNKTPF